MILPLRGYAASARGARKGDYRQEHEKKLLRLEERRTAPHRIAMPYKARMQNNLGISLKSLSALFAVCPSILGEPASPGDAEAAFHTDTPGHHSNPDEPGCFLYMALIDNSADSSNEDFP